MLVDTHTCERYLRFSIYSNRPNDYYDMYFKYEDSPSYVRELYIHIEENTRISEDNGFITTEGPSLDKKLLHKVSYVNLHDYNMMISRETEFQFDHNLSNIFAKNFLKPIYEDIIS